MSNEIANSGEILLYSYEGSKTYIDVYFRDETFWLTQSGIAELFNCSSDNISHEDAVKKVGEVYTEFRKKQDEDYVSELDRETARYLKGES